MKVRNIVFGIGCAISIFSAIGCGGSGLDNDSIKRLVDLDQIERYYLQETRGGWITYHYGDPIYSSFKEIEKNTENELRSIDQEKDYILKMYRRWEVLVKHSKEVRKAIIERSGYKGELLRDFEKELKKTDDGVKTYLEKIKPK